MLTSKQRVRLNGKRPRTGVVRSMAHALNDAAVRTEKGGYIFKAGLDGEVLLLGLLPGLINARRTVHHEIELGAECPLILNGFVTIKGALTVIPLRQGGPFRPAPEDVPALRKLMGRFAHQMLAWGVSAEMPVDEISQTVLLQFALTDSAPGTLADLA